jgi:exonuclease SbcC
LKAAAAVLGFTVNQPIQNVLALSKSLEEKSSRNRLMNLARVRRDLLAASERLSTLETIDKLDRRTLLEENDLLARQHLEQWRREGGLLLEKIIEALLHDFPSLPSPRTVDPEVARLAALHTVNEEIQRYSELLSKQEMAAKRVADIQRNINQLQERSNRLDEQIGPHTSNAGALAKALAGMLPHIHSQECPICGRDFSEISSAPLASEVSQRVAALNESAGLLDALLRARSTTVSQLAAARREHEELSAGQFSQVIAEESNAARARLESMKRRLEDLAQEVQRGAALVRNSSAAAQTISEFRESDSQMSSLIETVRSAAASLSRPFTYPSSLLRSVLSQLLEFAEREEAELIRLEEQLESAASAVRALETRGAERKSLVSERETNQTELDRLKESKQKADDAIEVARTLGKTVLEVRTSIVRRVFNDSLNKLWADLFTRLAPEENFVPAFALPEKAAGDVEAVLETVYRKGLKGGNPQAMLSAGNLNTAALTLFLALHLSLAPRLPWLLIDDPVQSMDEVHISQFAALLRTLSKRSDRRVVIAIHERPLFDYLALELSPAFPQDKLITVDLGRSASGETIVRAKHHFWQEDKAISAA